MTRFPRLTHAQWENATRDLLHLDQVSGLSATFAPDPSTKFDTSVDERKVSTTLWADYQGAAEQLAATVAHDTVKLARVVPSALPPAEPARSEAFVTAFGRRAFRRPLAADETSRYASLFQQGATLIGGDAVAAGVELVLRAMLQAPQFLYRIESSQSVDGDVIWLSGYEVASRLSFALWNTMPSDDLLTAAGAGELDTADGVSSWATRMVADARAALTVRSFHEQLLRVSIFGSALKDPTRFPNFTPALGPVLRDEARMFIDEVLNNRGGSAVDLLTAPFSFVNDQTAPFYGLAAKFGTTMTRVDLDPSQRAGILTQIGFLSTNGTLTQSDPIHRGVVINSNLLCVELHPPPNMVPALPPEMQGQSNRQRIEAHTNACGQGCHDTLINPLGFAFEHYDAVGAYRDTDNGLPVDSIASYQLDGKTVTYASGPELVRLIAESDQFHDCYAKNWLEYAFGRPPQPVEAAAVKRLSTVSKAATPIRNLLVNAVALKQFRARPATEEGSP